MAARKLKNWPPMKIKSIFVSKKFVGWVGSFSANVAGFRVLGDDKITSYKILKSS